MKLDTVLDGQACHRAVSQSKALLKMGKLNSVDANKLRFHLDQVALCKAFFGGIT